MKIQKIEKVPFNGNVYNLELESKVEKDDLFWVEGTSGIVTHNCFPKDLAALTYVAEQNGVDTTVLTAAKAKNDLVRQNKDWEAQVGRAVSED